MGKSLLIYGSYGYTGQLMVEEAVKQGLKPILAGRDMKKLIPISEKYQLDYRVFSVENASGHLAGIDVLLNCAGPFSQTAKHLVESCLAKQIHYLDITGEIAVFQLCYALNEEAMKKNVVILPGIGFDIVPTDCLAALLADKLPDANRIDLAFSFGTKMSIGTAKTSAENFGKGGIIRENHELKTVENAHRIKNIPFQNKSQWTMSIPWGDVFTSHISTKVPNGMVFMAMPKAEIYLVKILNPIKAIIDTKIGQKLVKGFMNIFLNKGPNEDARTNERTQFWGEASNSKNQKVTITMSAPNVYTLTAVAGIAITKHLLEHNANGGYYTPSMLLGKDFIASIEGVEIAY
jgi:short subunit dehydrogenase-like uncharacterized protein